MVLGVGFLAGAFVLWENMSTNDFARRLGRSGGVAGDWAMMSLARREKLYELIVAGCGYDDITINDFSLSEHFQGLHSAHWCRVPNRKEYTQRRRPQLAG